MLAQLIGRVGLRNETAETNSTIVENDVEKEPVTKETTAAKYEIIAANLEEDKTEEEKTMMDEIREIDINKIKLNPYQPRREFEENALEELSMSIMKYGLIQPITVRETRAEEYELIAGERRLRAGINAGFEKIYARVMRVTGTESAVLALIENIQRENLDYMEEAEAFSMLISEHGLTQEELAEKIGKNQSTIANKIRILKLSPEIRALLKENNLTERHARALLRLNDEKLRKKALNTIINRGLNVAKTDLLIEEILEGEENKKEKRSPHEIRIFKDIRIFTNTIKQAVDMMQKSGIDAESLKSETEDYIEYKIKIPKKVKSVSA